LIGFESTIQHLLNLIDDDSPQIQKIIRETILNKAWEFIHNRRLIVADAPAEFRVGLNRLLNTLHPELVEAAFRQISRNNLEDIDLQKAILIICYWYNKGIDIPKIINQLDLMAEKIGQGIPISGHPLSFIDHISYHLFVKHGFYGNEEDYYNPDNSLLNKVLEKKKGIPITLSVLYILIADRLKIPILGVPMPAHFILKFDNGTDEIFFDPFYKGKIYTRKECLNYLTNAKSFEIEEILSGCTNYQIVLRILRNQHLVLSSYENDPEKIVDLEKFIDLIKESYQPEQNLY
jgi:regulator of sirC expression with transglutaminase-like and TPR domain